MQFKTVIKRHKYIVSIGIALIITGEFLPFHNYRVYESVFMSNLTQLTGLLFTCLPIIVWYLQRKRT